MKNLLLLFSLLLIIACEKTEKNEPILVKKQPNILWIVCEDSSPTLSMYGDTTAKTPNLDKLAKESMIYDNAFAPVGVCAPSRSSIITGMYPTSIGTMHMRTGKDVASWGKRKYKTETGINDLLGNPIREYSAVLPAEVKCFTEYLRAEGYFCTNNQKTDYQFAAPLTAWDQNYGKSHWRNRPEGKPFFSVFNIELTHESKLWKHEKLPLTVRVDCVKVPPYLPDTPVSRKTIARHYSNLELMDAKVGDLIKQLKEDGLYDNTIVFFYSDHGGPLPRQKREILDSGLKVPFLVKGLNSKNRGRTDQLVSFVDLAPTVLSLAGIEPPKYLNGNAFLGDYSEKSRKYVFGSSDRFDEFSDRIRSVRDKRFLYLKNFHPDLTKYKDVGYRKSVPLMQDILRLKMEKKLNSIQDVWFQQKTSEELYDCIADPFNLNNLASDVNYSSQLNEYRAVLKKQTKQNGDLGVMPESELIAKMWPNKIQPTAKLVTIERKAETILLSCATKGSSIAYLVTDSADQKITFNSGWKLYTHKIPVQKGKYLHAISQRIGFKNSPSQLIKMD